jgi:hypothetical protein
MNILIKFPSRGRPDKFKNTLSIYLDRQSNKHNIKFICSFDIDDSSMNSDDIKNYLNNKTNIKYYYGLSSNKIEAINANMDILEPYNILILAADDLFPIVDGYDDIIVNDMIKYYPDMDGTLHYMNPNWEERLDVGCIMTKKYYDRFNFIYNPLYKSIYCDNEYMEVAKILNKHKYIANQIFAHHYVISDPTANKNWVFNREDEEMYNYRRQNNFFIETYNV